VSFLNQDRTLFQSVPIVFTTRPGLLAEPPSTGIISAIDLSGTLSAALAAQPNTKQVFVVSGVAPFDKLYDDIFKEQQAAFAGRVAFHSLSGLSMVDLEQRVRHLPSDAIVYFLSLSDDGAGHTFMPLDAVDAIAAAANVPVYTWHESALGHGVVGGHLHSSLNDARETARIAARVLQGESPQSIPVTTVHSYTYEFDWRQLQRWKISESSLPAGSVIRFREATLLGQQHAQIVQALGEVGMFRRQPRAADLDRPAMQPFRLVALALAAQRLGQVVQALRRRRVRRAERSVADHERVGVVGQGIADAALGMQDEAEIVRRGGPPRVAFGQFLGQCQSRPELALGGGEVASVGARDPLLADALPLGRDILAKRRPREQGQREADDESQWLRRGLP